MTLLTTIMFIYFISYLSLYHYSFITTVTLTLKLFYLPITTMFFYSYKEEIDKKYLVITLLLYITIFLLSYILGIGQDAYITEEKKEGFKGLFNSVNEFSAIIITLLPISIKYLKEKKKYILALILIILICIIFMLTGTKVILGGLAVIIIFFLIEPTKKYYKVLDKKKKVITSIILLTILIITSYLITFTTPYKNAIIQMKFFKVENILSLEGINKVIFNDRFSFIPENHQRMKNSNIYEKLFGLKQEPTRKAVEIDLLDIFYQYGIIGLIIMISIIAYYIHKVKPKGIYLLTITLFLLISETSGHVLIYPAVSIYFSLMIYFQKKELSNK